MTSSQQQQTLFTLIRDEPQDRAVSDAIAGAYDEGKDLTWVSGSPLASSNLLTINPVSRRCSGVGTRR